MEQIMVTEENTTWLSENGREGTAETARMKENFGFFGPVSFLYALFYAFCMFRNGSGVTFPFFIAASLLFLCFSLSKLEITLRRGSAFYMVSMMLLAVSTFCTDDAKIIAWNKTGIFLLMMSLLLNQFYDTTQWKLGKYLGSIFILSFACLGEIARPFSDGAAYVKKKGFGKNRTLWYALLGVVAAVPLVVIVVALLAGADAVFRQLTDSLVRGIRLDNVFEIGCQVGFLFFASYLLLAYLCKRSMNQSVKDNRRGEPVLAITITAILSLIYLLFSGIQIVCLFLGKMQLPEGYTYAAYAREGFFQLLAVSILNLIIVLFCMSFFRESKVLKGILTVMSLCTFIMIASSALRMMIYIRFYYLTFLRILVLWALVVLFLLFAGVIYSIFREKFPLFRYGMTVVTIWYLVLSFSHPDLLIAWVDVSNAPHSSQEWTQQSDFFLAETPYLDYNYLSHLSADAAPILIPYLVEQGYDIGQYSCADEWNTDKTPSERMGAYYLRNIKKSTENFGIRTYNMSRHMALRQMKKQG